jgi:two-component sensor histidine kinase
VPENWKSSSLANDVRLVSRELAYRCSHDLGAPVKSITGLLNLMEKSACDRSNLALYAELMQRSIGRIRTLASGMEKMLTNELTGLTFQNILLRHVVRRALVSLKDEIAKRSVVVSVRSDGGSRFRSDRFRISSVIRELILNAIIFSDDRKTERTIDIHLSSFPTAAVVDVRDNGIGLDPRAAAHVFDPFFRGSEKSTGFGLGLFIVQSMVKKLGGTVNLHTEPRKGTAFIVWIPNNRRPNDHRPLADSPAHVGAGLKACEAHLVDNFYPSYASINKASRAVNHFLYRYSTGFRGPFEKIETILGYIVDGENPASRRRAFASMRRHIERVERCIKHAESALDASGLAS